MSNNVNPSKNNRKGTKEHRVMGGPHSQGRFEKAKDFKATSKKLFQYLYVYRIRIIFVSIFTIASTVFNIIGPKILGNATTEIYNGLVNKISGVGAGINFDNILKILIYLILIYLVSLMFSYLQGFIMTDITMDLTYKLRDDIIKKINRLPLKYFDTTNNGEVLSRVTNDIDTLSQTLNQGITQIITSITTMIGITIMMFKISWQMSIVAICIIPISFIFVIFVVKKSQIYFVRQQNYLGHLNGHIEEMYAGHNVMKAFNGERESIKEFDEYNNELYASLWKSQFLSGLIMPIMSFISNLGYIGICILGGYLSINNGLPVGDIQAFLQYVRQFTQPIIQISNVSNVLQQTMAAAERVFEFLEEDEEKQQTDSPICLIEEDCKSNSSLVRINGDVEFQHVKFGYSEDNVIIDDFSISVKSGQRIAIVGPTGSGKTTIVKLLMRFYDINGGSILIDKYNIYDFSRNGLRSLFGMVLQETWLYNDTIKDNIRYGNPTATDDEVFAAAKAAQVDHFVRTLPHGYETVLNEEVSNISLGQKQLLTIARAILSNPKILILDEATSSVDTRTEILIQKAMDNLMNGKTSFIIAHRLSTIRDADLILVMKDGAIIEQGNHDELMKQDGFYASFYK